MVENEWPFWGSGQGSDKRWKAFAKIGRVRIDFGIESAIGQPIMSALVSSTSRLRLLSAATFTNPNSTSKGPNWETKEGTPDLTTNGATPDPIIAAIHGRAQAITPTLQSILRSRPPSHWGLNE